MGLTIAGLHMVNHGYLILYAYSCNTVRQRFFAQQRFILSSKKVVLNDIFALHKFVYLKIQLAAAFYTDIGAKRRLRDDTVVR